MLAGLHIWCLDATKSGFLISRPNWKVKLLSLFTRKFIFFSYPLPENDFFCTFFGNKIEHVHKCRKKTFGCITPSILIFLKASILFKLFAINTLNMNFEGKKMSQCMSSTLDKQCICINTQLKSSKKQLKWNVCIPKSNSNDRYAIKCDTIAYHLVHFVSIWVINKCQSGIDFFFH